MKLPKDFKVFITADKSVHVILNNYDGNFLSFLIIVCAAPLFIATVLLALNMNILFLITFILLAAVIYWCVYHYKDRTKFIFTKEEFIVIEGMYQIETCRVRYKDIIRTEKIVIAGSSYQGSRTGSTTINHPNYELYLHTNDERLLVTKHVGPNGQAYLDHLIHERMAAR
ncbi:hypothetical protein [Cytophaga aurantiaca]|uniref:hypothetical protein n=1 Tax=Cytophaga aurantiaca TaxID=29530 RepID=UPI0003710BB0|nr:hypothetical protein [Cytophaga aurantiaca]